MLMRNEVLTRLRDGSHWQFLVPENRAFVVDRLLDAAGAGDRPGVVEVTRLRLGEVHLRDGTEVAPPPLVHVAVPIDCLSQAELHQVMACPCGRPHVVDDFTPHGFVVPLHLDDLWPVGEALRLFEAWLRDEPEDVWIEDEWEDDLDDDEEEETDDVW